MSKDSEKSSNRKTSGSGTSRSELAREAAVLQIKLVADGIRDAILIPVSLIAALIGLIRGGPEPDREYREVLRLGRQTERWINLFGYHRPYSRAGSMDTVIDRVEEVLREQYEKGRATREARDAIKTALEPFNKKASGKSDDSVEK